MSDEKLQDRSRRNLIKQVGMVAAVGALVGGVSRAVAKEPQESALTATSGYQQTPHVNDFYRSLRGMD